MPRKIIEPNKILKNGKPVWKITIPVDITKGPSQRRFFRTKEKADVFAHKLNQQRAGNPSEVMSLPRADQEVLLAAYNRLGSADAVLRAVEAYERTRARIERTVKDVGQELLTARVKSGRSDPYIAHLEVQVRSFCRMFGDRPCSDIQTGDVQVWLDSGSQAATSKIGMLTRIRTLFAFAVSRGYASTNPAKAVDKPKVVDAPPSIVTPGEARRIMEAAREIEPGLVPYFALCLFAGLRPSEARRITPEEIREGYVEVKAAKSKTRRRRLVTINDTLRAWLALGGEFQPINWRKRFSAIVKAAGFAEWPADCMRHSFVSYSLPVHGSARTAQEAGHSEAVLFAHYRELVTAAQTAEFWAVLPNGGGWGN